MKKIAHLTSVHQRYDTRIFLKMCSSLAACEYDVSLVVADGEGEEIRNAVKILDSGPRKGGRVGRMTKTVARVYAIAKQLNADIYHLHDPELIPIGLKLKKLGKCVIFDAHEDLPKQLRSKPYLNKIARIVLPAFFELYERYACAKFDAVIGATPVISEKFGRINGRAVNINNYPILGELANSMSWTEKVDEVCYLGGIAEIRGIREVIRSLEFSNGVRLNLAGKFSESNVESEVKSWKQWENVNELGFISRTQAASVLAKCKAGIVTFHSVPNHIDAQPNKMFEYMSAGLPIITSNFPLWREVVEGNKCGICVDPTKPEDIASAINYLMTNPEDAQRMAENGRRAVLNKYNWPVEENKLIELYEGLLS
jgi:glycosyltransferase involved in cell wall biosynthesis